MKTLMIAGAMIGFCLGLTLGFVGHADWPATFWRGCAAAAGLGCLMRWWGRVWLRGLRASLEERQAAESVANRQPQTTSLAKR